MQIFKKIKAFFGNIFIPNYQYKDFILSISSDLSIGLRPSVNDILKLEKNKFKMIISLCAETDSDNAISKAYDLKIRTIRLPFEKDEIPLVRQMAVLCELIKNKNNSKIYLHCNEGLQRTAIGVACFRVYCQDWDYYKAIEEARYLGRINEKQEIFIAYFSQLAKEGKIE